MHRAALLKCSQFSPASPNRCSFLIRQWTAAFKERVGSINVALNQMIGCCCFFKILFHRHASESFSTYRRTTSRILLHGEVSVDFSTSGTFLLQYEVVRNLPLCIGFEQTHCKLLSSCPLLGFWCTGWGLMSCCVTVCHSLCFSSLSLDFVCLTYTVLISSFFLEFCEKNRKFK